MTTDALEAARAGSGTAFAELVEGHRGGLHRHCYRMLGSLDDADDLVQETLLAAWRGMAGFDGRSSVSTWLYRIATNRCLNAIRDGRRRPPSEPVPPFDPPEPSSRSEVTWLQPYPDRTLDPQDRLESRESIELAFVAALQRLPPRQAAALLLVDVLGYDTAGAATMLDLGPTAAKGLLQRARAATGGLPTSPEPDAGRARLAARFAEAYAADDVDGVVALLTDDAWLAMPPAPHIYAGPGPIAGFLRASATAHGAGITLVPTGANRQPAFGCYLGGAPVGVVVITVCNDKITGITRFLDPGLNRRF
ncbi:RNA polymerase sigma factor [Microlunatus endophyticus]|uniref:RNA polymerase sigma factor n=1 Tax=Microlunatus endophyticus TaxID=1716077 RepID=A0A917SDV5_9ACTN|nr:RNA polymerase subunit sigma-70 [Microlunatus endophyticus]GGL71646.1 RNA polymerase sigma factor [Microlunatus endophyticus]